MFIDRSLAKGLGYGIGAGLCWGVIFLGPALTPGLSGLQFAVLRFLCYGVFSLALLLPRWRDVCSRLTRADWKSLFWLSLIGNLLYYSLVGSAVQRVGIATTSLIVGLIPVVITLAGRNDANAVALIRLIPSLCCAIAGVVLISLSALQRGENTEMRVGNVLGLICATGAMISWSWYAVSNARRLKVIAKVSAHEWSLLTGIMTGALALLLAIPVFALEGSTYSAPEWINFLLVAGGVALLSSVVGGACWNQASRLLPLALGSQVLVIETLAGLLFGFLWEQRLPSLLEVVAMGSLVSGVVWCLGCYRGRAGRVVV